MKIVDLEKLLPADIPAGEHVLWHSRPQWVSLLRRAFYGDAVALYFAAMTIVNFIWSYSEGGLPAGGLSALKTLGAAVLALGLLAVLAWLCARTSFYLITNKRVVMKVGIALPIFFNLPFSSIETAAVRLFDDGTGDIPLGLSASQRIGYIHLWPHARAFRLSRPEPAFRSISDAKDVAETLSLALIKACNERNVAIAVTTNPDCEIVPGYHQNATASA
jgi:Bacterial PH domain